MGDPPQTPLHSGSIMSLVDSSNNYNSNGQQQQGQEQQHGYLASRHLMSQDLASRHPTLLKQLNSPPTICKCSGQSRWPNCQCTSTSQLATSFCDKENQVPRGQNSTPMEIGMLCGALFCAFPGIFIE